MPISADQERRLLNHYKLTSLYPDTWPHHDNDGDESSDEEPNAAQRNGGAVRQPSKLPSGGMRHSSSKYRTMDRHASIRSAASMGPDSVVQHDEPDPLGMTSSVAAELRRRGLPVEEDLQLRNRFLLSSTTFSPALFLSQVHQDASTADLLRGLNFLTRSIEQKSASLKVLVEANFEKFVKAKATIDNVYTEMRTQGAGGVAETPASASASASASTPNLASPGRRPHSRHTSRSQGGAAHFRNTSGPFSPTIGGGANARATTAKKNALTRESEYGVLGIKAPLHDVAIKAEEVWGPALGGREKEETLKQVIGAMNQHRELFRLGTTLSEAVKKNDYDTVIASHKLATKSAEHARLIAATAQQSNTPLTDPEAQILVLTAKAHADVTSQLEPFKRSLWRRLEGSHGQHTKRSASTAVGVDESPIEKEEHMQLIGVLLQLGVDENPIWEWLNGRWLYLKDRIARSFERARIEIEILRRRLATQSDERDGRVLAGYLRAAAGDAAVRELDSPPVIAFWEKVHGALRGLLGTQEGGVVGEVVEFWEVVQGFVDGRAQKGFPAAVFAAGLEHLDLGPDDVANLRSGALDLVTQLRESITAFFTDPPVEDLSDLYSPIPPAPITPDSAGNRTPGSATARRAFTFDPNNVPPPSRRRGEAWEKFAFCPPSSNSLSGAHYLSRLLTLVGTAACDLANLSVVKQTRPSAVEPLKLLVAVVRERSIQALCAAWATDAERCKYLESWRRSAERRDLTTMPGIFMAFEERVLAGFQRIAYVSEVGQRGVSGADAVVMPPPAKLLQVVRGTFVTSLYRGLSGMVENAEKVRGREGDEEGVVVGLGEDGGVDAGNRNVRILLSLSNLSHLRAETIPHLISAFESSFSVKLTEETKTIRDVLSQIDARLFQSYVKPTVDRLSILIHDGIHSATWAPAGVDTRPTNAKGYVYDVLLALVLVHAEVSTTAAGMTNQILSYLLEQSSLNLLDAFKSSASSATHYTLPALMQATLDVEFLAQTLSNYTTERAGEVQSQIYLALDERTDDEARKRLQGELPEMRTVLKRLREGSKGVFGCFKRERKGRGGRGAAGGGSGGESTSGRA